MFKWQQAPLVQPALFLIGGILVSDYLLFGYFSLFFVYLSFFILYFFNKKPLEYRYRWVPGVVIMAGIFFSGVFRTFQNNEINSVMHFSKILPEGSLENSKDKQEVDIIGVVSELPDRGNNVKVTIEVRNVNDSLASGHLLLYLKPEGISNEITYGDVLYFRGFVNPIRNSKNPETFDFQKYMKYKNIRYLSYVKKENLIILGTRQGSTLWHWAYDCQDFFISVLASYLSDSNEVFTVASALILGARSDIPDDLVEAYVNTGALHVLSVSGLHVGLIGMVAERILKQFRIRKRWWKWMMPCLQIAAIWIFSFIAGAAPCILRAAVMFSFLIAGRAYNQSVNIYNILACSVIVLLMWNPYYLYDVGFQLSYVGLVGIIYFQPKIFQSGMELVYKTPWLAAIYTFRFNDFDVKNKYVNAVFKFPVAKYFWELTSVSIAASLAVTPLSIYYFHQFPTYFMLSGCIVVPLAAFALYFGIILFVLHALWQTAAVWVGKLLFATIWVLNNSLYLIDKIPPGAIENLWLSGIATLLLYAILFFWVKRKNSQEEKYFIYGAGSIAAVTMIFHSVMHFIHLQQKEILIYNTGYYTLIDCIDGKKVFTVANEDIPDRMVNFAAYNYRLRKDIKPNNVNMVGLKDSITDKDFYYNKGFLAYGDKVITLLSEQPQKSAVKVKTDYIFIRDNPKIDLSKISEYFDFQAIIFDASNKRYKVEKWKTYCKENNIAFHDINDNFLKIKIGD